jgi:N-acetylglucosamine malate deacetylase 1
MGATIARLVHEGHEVDTLFFTDGVHSRYDTLSAAGLEDAGLARGRRTQAMAAAASVLGHRVSGLPSRIFPDNAMDTLGVLAATQVVERKLVHVEPDVVWTHWPGDLNVDHRLVAQATLTACRPLPGSHVQAVYAFETPSSTEWAFGAFGGPTAAFAPNLFMDITGYLSKKEAAMRCYDEEVREPPHPRAIKSVLGRAAYWGSVCGCAAAEAFVILYERR